MGMLAQAVAETKAADPLALFAEIARAGRTSKAGPTVNLETAIRVAAFFACLRVLSQGVAQVPFKLFQDTEQNGLTKIVPARTHRVYDLVAAKPNDWQTDFEFRETQMIHAALGNSYAWKNVIRGEIRELILLDPGRMKVEQPDEYSAPIYSYTGKDGKTVPFPASQIWHLRGPSWSSFLGIEILNIARDVLGLSIALDDSVSGLHKSGVKPTGVYSVDGTLNPTQHADLTKWLKQQAADPGAPLILDRGAKWLQTVMTSVDAQTKEMRDQQIPEVCRFMGVSPHMIGHTDKTSTYASAEQFNIQHVVHTLGPHYVRIEKSADVNLLTRQERQAGYYFKHNANALMRGSTKERGEYFAKALGSGGSPAWMTQDEVRALEEMNPFGGTAAVLPVTTNAPKPASAAQA